MTAITASIDWQGITLSVTYEPAFLGMAWNAHLQIRATTPDRAPLPISETGYRSYFCHPDEIAAAGGPVAYVIAWLEQDAQSAQWQESQAIARQLRLF